jgi:hypothetical protein
MRAKKKTILLSCKADITCFAANISDILRARHNQLSLFSTSISMVTQREASCAQKRPWNAQECQCALINQVVGFCKEYPEKQRV